MTMDNQIKNVTYSIDDILLVLDNDLRVVDASPAFYKTFALSPAEILCRHLSEIGNGQWSVPELLLKMNDLWPAGGQFNSFELQANCPVIGTKRFLLNAKRSSKTSDGIGTIVLAIDDVTKNPDAMAEYQPRPPLLVDMDAPIT
jgi:PAS domain-containing protein